MLKRCTKCRNILPISEFSRNQATADGLCCRCKQCARAYYLANREATNEANVKWRRAHPEKTRAYAAKWRAANPETAAAYTEQYRADGRANEASKRWAKRNAEMLAAKRRTPEQREKDRERQRRWEKANPERVRETQRKGRSSPEFKLKDRANQSTRRAHKQSLPGKYTAEDITRMAAASSKCHICKRRFTSKRPPTVDHVLPISSSLGSNDPSNLTLVCRSCNSRKRDSRYNPLTGQGLLL